MKVAMSDAARTVCRLRLRMKCIMCSDPMLFVRGREKIMTVKIAWLLCHLHCYMGHVQGHYYMIIFTHMHSLQYIATCNPYKKSAATRSLCTTACCPLVFHRTVLVHGGQRAEAPACQRLQECLQLHHTPPA